VVLGRRAFALIGLLVVGMATTGCFSRATGCPKGKTCLRYMAWGNPQQFEVERQIVKRFNEQNPDLHVTVFSVPGTSYAQKQIMMLGSRTAPDVMRVDHYFFPNLAAKGHFTDLTPYAKADPSFDPDVYFPTALEECYVEGKLMALNVLFGGIAMYYNKTMFREAGLEDPWELHQQGLWTWARFRQSAIALTRFEGGRPKRFGTTVPQLPAIIACARGFGGEMIDLEANRSLLDQPGTVAAYQFLADLVWVDRAAPTPAQGANFAFTFESGKVGMVLDFMGMIPRYREVAKGFEWDVAPIPKGPAGGRTVIKGNQLVIPKNCKNPEAAWRFVKYMASQETERVLYAQIRRCFPTRKDVAYSPEYLQTDQPPYQLQAFVESVENGRILPINERWVEWINALQMETDNLFAGRERDASVVLRRAKDKINTILSEDPGL
jgi:multiple sugar transport system substrate-binding protein